MISRSVIAVAAVIALSAAAATTQAFAADEAAFLPVPTLVAPASTAAPVASLTKA